MFEKLIKINFLLLKYYYTEISFIFEKKKKKIVDCFLWFVMAAFWIGPFGSTAKIKLKKKQFGKTNIQIERKIFHWSVKKTDFGDISNQNNLDLVDPSSRSFPTIEPTEKNLGYVIQNYTFFLPRFYAVKWNISKALLVQTLD